MKPEKKPDLLLKLLEESGWNQVLVFCRTKVGADMLSPDWSRRGSGPTPCTRIGRCSHRTRALERFSEGRPGSWWLRTSLNGAWT